MKFKNVRPAETGEGVEFNVEASNQEVAWLVNYAVEDLLKAGIIAVHPFPEEQEVTIQGGFH